jgi:hypothetical protein
MSYGIIWELRDLAVHADSEWQRVSSYRRENRDLVWNNLRRRMLLRESLIM